MAGWEQIGTGLASGLQTGLQLGLAQQKLEAERTNTAIQQKQARTKNAFEGFKAYFPMLQSPSETIRKTAMEGVIALAKDAGADLGWSPQAINTISRAGWADEYLQPLKTISKLTQEFEKGTYGQGPQAEKIYMMGINGELGKIYAHADRKQIQGEAQAAMTRSREFAGAEAAGRLTTRPPGEVPASADIESLALGGKEMQQAAGKFVEGTIPEKEKTPESVQVFNFLTKNLQWPEEDASLAVNWRKNKPQDVIEKLQVARDALMDAGLTDEDQKVQELNQRIVRLTQALPVHESLNDFTVFYRSEYDKLIKRYPQKSKPEIEGMISEAWEKKLNARSVQTAREKEKSKLTAYVGFDAQGKEQYKRVDPTDEDAISALLQEGYIHESKWKTMDLMDKALAASGAKKRAGKQTSGKGNLMADMPPAKGNKDRIIRDTETGDRLRSDGKVWIQIGR